MACAGLSGGQGPDLHPTRPYPNTHHSLSIGVIDADDANIIAETRLEGVTVQIAAARCGIHGQLASHWRDQAEKRLINAIRKGELAHVRLRPHPAKPVHRTTLRAWPGE